MFQLRNISPITLKLIQNNQSKHGFVLKKQNKWIEK